MNIRIICPTRQRAARCALMLESFLATRSSPDTRIFCYVDKDDPEAADYRALFFRLKIRHAFGERLTMPEVINAGVRTFDEDFYGEVNDDHIYRTANWDRLLAAEIQKHGGGLAYGRTKNLPSAVLISRDCIEALGWFMPPGFQHQFVDNALHELYTEAGKSFLVPEVWIEHCHPDFGTAPMDATYTAVRETWYQGQEQLHNWRANEKPADLIKLSMKYDKHETSS